MWNSFILEVILQCWFHARFNKFVSYYQMLMTDLLINWLVDWLIGWLVYWLIGWLVDWLIDWLVGWFIDWLVDWLIDWLIDWLVDWLIDWLVGWLTDWLGEWGLCRAFRKVAIQDRLYNVPCGGASVLISKVLVSREWIFWPCGRERLLKATTPGKQPLLSGWVQYSRMEEYPILENWKCVHFICVSIFRI